MFLNKLYEISFIFKFKKENPEHTKGITSTFYVRLGKKKEYGKKLFPISLVRKTTAYLTNKRSSPLEVSWSWA